MSLKVRNEPLVTVGNAVIADPQAPIQIASKVGQGLTLTAAKALFVLEYINPQTWETEGASARGIAILVSQVQSGDELSIDTEDYAFGGEGITIGATAADSATNLAEAINADSVLVTAKAVGNTVYITAADPGDAGNEIALVATAGGRITVSGATLTGGIDPAATEE